MEKEIIVLTKSSKKGGYCIAGVDTTTGEWIRPVSNDTRKEGAVPLTDILYEDGTELQLLDIVKINFIKPKPTKAQPENYLYDDSRYWIKTGSSSIDEVIKFRGYDKINKVFYNNKKELEEEELGSDNSLLLLNVKNSCIFIKTFSDSGDKSIQFNFEYNNQNYIFFKVSDKKILDKYSDKCNGRFDEKEFRRVVFSLTDKFKGKYYKMVAQLFD